MHIINARMTDGSPTELLIKDGKIAAIAPRIEAGCDVLDAHGLTVAPALIDAHVHLRDPGQTHKEDILTGADAAAAGGVGTVLCMPNTAPPCDSVETLRYIADKARDAKVRVLPIAAVTRGQHGAVLTDIEALANAGAVAFSDDGRPVADAEIMRCAMYEAARVGKPLVSHCEDLGFDDAARTTFTAHTDATKRSARDCGFDCDLPVNCAESAMAARDLALCIETGLPLHIAHVSTLSTCDLLREAKRRGANVTAETCPHYLLLTSGAVDIHGANARMNPQLATAADRAAVLDAVCDGTIDILVTDHAPHTAEEKASASPPNGIVGLETLLCGAITALRGRLTLAQIIDMMTAVPAKIFGLDGGRLDIGAPADLVLFDPDERWTLEASALRSKSRNTPFDGFGFAGRVYVTIVGGSVVFTL